jgi:Xaa-Pro aminopeptidase
MKEAALWTDGRYFAQAEKLNPDVWTLMRDGDTNNPPPTKSQWLLSQLQDGDLIGLDPSLIAMSLFDQFKSEFKKNVKKKNINWKIINENLIDAIWTWRPAAPKAPLIVHPIEYAGMPVPAKLARVREFFVVDKLPASMKAKDEFSPDLHIHAMIFQDLADIAWTLNLRGNDIEFNPVFISYLIVFPEKLELYIDSAKITPEVRSYLNGIEGLTLKAYDSFFASLESLANSLPSTQVFQQKILHAH